MQQQALSAFVAWVRLDRALEAYHAELRRAHGITGLQLSVLQICAERPMLPLAALRKALVMHAATLGQSIDELRRRELVIIRTDQRDRRARLVGLTPSGAELLSQVELAGPALLRARDADGERLDRLRAALGDAIELFGLEAYDPARPRTGDAD